MRLVVAASAFGTLASAVFAALIAGRIDSTR